MSILRINASPKGPVIHGAPTPVTDGLNKVLADTGPVLIMIHGFKYRPGAGYNCPHRTIFSSSSEQGAAAWPRHLGFGTGKSDEGVAIAFGWNARSFSLQRAFGRAKLAGRQLADVISRIRRISPERPIHILAHSMGSEVAFKALKLLPAHSVRRVITLTGASFCSTALRAMRSPAGATAELVNVTSRENDIFDFLFERLVTPTVTGDRAMGIGLTGRNMVTLQLDHARHLKMLAQLGSPIAPASRRICHWSGYMRPGVLTLWSRAIRNPESLPLKLLSPEPPTPRWSRLSLGQNWLGPLSGGANPAT